MRIDTSDNDVMLTNNTSLFIIIIYYLDVQYLLSQTVFLLFV